jgi:hypothetical protein
MLFIVTSSASAPDLYHEFYLMNLTEDVLLFEILQMAGQQTATALDIKIERNKSNRDEIHVHIQPPVDWSVGCALIILYLTGIATIASRWACGNLDHRAFDDDIVFWIAVGQGVFNLGMFTFVTIRTFASNCLRKFACPGIYNGSLGGSFGVGSGSAGG